jgi:hypothetical protein
MRRDIPSKQKRRRKDVQVPQKRRVRLSFLVLGTFGCLIVFLMAQQTLEQREGSSGVLDYLLAADDSGAVDPLGISSSRLELVGVSNDGKVVGYATDDDVAQTMMTLDRAMRARGWLVLEMDTQGISSYVWQGYATDASAGTAQASTGSARGTDGLTRTPGAYVLFVCNARSGGSSVVAELL